MYEGLSIHERKSSQAKATGEENEENEEDFKNEEQYKDDKKVQTYFEYFDRENFSKSLLF